jgi:hypothetical protein
MVTMRRILPVALVAGALGVWAGVNGWESGTVATRVHGVLAVLVGGNLVFCAWVLRKAKPGSGEAIALPPLMFGMGAMLIGILPRLFWPSEGAIHLAGSLASVALMIIVVVVQIRHRRKLRGSV